jgi:16S rRNA (guanine527-N7)-methyltransferase
MSITSREASNPNGTRLNALLVDAGLEPVRPELALSFDNYLSLLLRWNERVNLTAIRDIEGILSRHFVESIVCARALPDETTTLLDFGSGAGFPGIPIALCRPEIAVTLAESQGKKAAFLREAVRVLGITTKVHSARAEALPIQFDCVTLHAICNSTDSSGRVYSSYDDGKVAGANQESAKGESSLAFQCAIAGRRG